VWGANMSFHAVQLPSLNMTEDSWIYIDWETSLGEMRLSQAGTVEDVPGATLAVTIDLADLHSPLGSVHNRQKQEVGRRLALNALAVAYGRKHINTGPKLKSVTRVVDGNIVVQISSASGDFIGSNDCIQCCGESAFEASIDGRAWHRVATTAPKSVRGAVQVSLDASSVAGAKWLRYANDMLVQCPFFDAGGLPLGPFKVGIDADGLLQADDGVALNLKTTDDEASQVSTAATAAAASTWVHLAKYDSTYDCSGRNNSKTDGCASMHRQKSLLDCQDYCARTLTPAGTYCTVFAFQESAKPDKNGTRGCWFRWGASFAWKDARDCPPPLQAGCHPSGDSSGCLVGKVNGCK
jgi:hypothetical protein